MPKYFCEYCGIYLTHSSPGGRNQHSRGRKHINNKIEYYSQILYEFQQSISDNITKMTSHLLNKPKSQINIQASEDNLIKKNKINDISEKNVSNQMQPKKAMVHIADQIPFSVPIQYVPNIPINEKIMKAIPNKLLLPQYKKINSLQEDISKREVIDINEGEKDEKILINQNEGKNRDKSILENLKKMKYSYNDPNPENNEYLIKDLLKIEEEDEEQNNKNK